MIGPITKAQYVKLTKGQLVPFDTCVAIQIKQYRLETKKLKGAELLVKGYDKQVTGLYKEIGLRDSVSNLLNLALKSKDSELAVKRQTIADLSLQNDVLAKQAVKKQTWWNRNKFFIGIIAGAGSVVFLTAK